VRIKVSGDNVGSPIFKAATHLWIKWLEIAYEHQQEALQARERSLQTAETGAEFSAALGDEMRASMVAITAAANAVDALYGEIKPLVPVPEEVRAAWKANRAPRHARIRETLKEGCALGRLNAEWSSRFKHLYRLRDPVVHHEIRSLPTVRHPNGRTNVSQEMADYSSENATAAVDLAFEVVLTTIRHPRSPDLTAWAERMAHVPDEQVEAIRRGS